MDDENNKVIIIESIINSEIFLNYLKKLIIDILHENNISFSSIKKDGHYYIVKLKKNSAIVFTMDILSKVSGISCIFIAKSLEIDYDILSKAVVQIGKKILLADEKFSITITTSKEHIFKKNEYLFFKKDLEFLIMSELSSLSSGIKYVRNESEADKILYVLIGTEVAYVSLSLKKGREYMPFNFLNEKVICPIYSEYSFLSLISILNSGFFPIPFIFYSDKKQLIKILKSFEKIIKRYPIQTIDVNLINFNDFNLNISRLYLKNDTNFDIDKKTMMVKLIQDEIIVMMLLQLKIDATFLSLPLLPFLHPLWFFKKNLLLSFESGKIPLTPFLFNYEFKNNLKDFYNFNNSAIDEQSLDSNVSFLDITQENFDPVYQKIVNLIKISSKEIAKFKLDMGKDDVLDILDSI
ncbi:MAG: hypothetical protein M3Z01_03030 [Thermoproteota archaeon]|nr:hypothetical protein [Thermoproteota archaeon]